VIPVISVQPILYQLPYGARKNGEIKKPMSIVAKANKVCKIIKKPMTYHQKQEKIKKSMSIAAKANKVCKSIKKPMSIPLKNKKRSKSL
jgi:hypothetical protein